MDYRDDFYTTVSIRRGDIEMSLHLNEDTLKIEPDTIHMVLFDENEHAIETFYGSDEILSVYLQEHPYKEEITSAIEQAIIYKWIL